MSKNRGPLLLGLISLAGAGALLRKGWGKDAAWWKRVPEMTGTVVRERLRRAGGAKPPRPWRPQWLPENLTLQSEARVNRHVPQERADLFMAVTNGSTEAEVLNWLYSTICLTKPSCILETGSYEGLGTIALATACRDNGFGVVHAVEIDADICKKVAGRLKTLGLDKYVQIHCQDSLTFLRETDLTFDFGFFDSSNPIRSKEYALCVERDLLRGVAAFHDTAPTHPLNFPEAPRDEQEGIRATLKSLAQKPGATGYLDSHLSRGFFVIFSTPRPPSAPLGQPA